MSGPIEGKIVAVSITSGVKHFERIPLPRGYVSGLQLAWLDATSAFSAPVLYVSNSDSPAVPADDATPSLAAWTIETGVAFDAVTASASGSQMLHMGNVGAKWLLVEISATANCSLELRPHSKE